MAIPANLQRERNKLDLQTRGTRFWWGIRAAMTIGMLNAPVLQLLHRHEGWAWNAAPLAIWGSGLALWWVASRACESERHRIEQKSSAGRFAGWRASGPIVLAGAGFLAGLRPSPFLQTEVLPFLLFAVLVFVMEQALAAKRASFDLLEAREQSLQARLAPHFLFNALNTVHAQIEHDPRAAQATTENLAGLFRQVLAVADRPSVPLREELAFVESYLALEKARLGARLQVRIEVPEELEAGAVPPLSLQVLVENAVKHGVAPREAGGEVRIGARREDRDLILEVHDPGTAGGSPRPGTGTALETLRRRLARPEDLWLRIGEAGTVAGFRWRQP